MSKLTLCLMMLALVAISGCAQMDKYARAAIAAEELVNSLRINISSGNVSFPAYLAAPGVEGLWPGVVMIHSFRGLEPGYMALGDRTL
jgi:carboxymethylenebutenolidase